MKIESFTKEDISRLDTNGILSILNNQVALYNTMVDLYENLKNKYEDISNKCDYYQYRYNELKDYIL